MRLATVFRRLLHIQHLQINNVEFRLEARAIFIDVERLFRRGKIHECACVTVAIREFFLE